MHHHRTACWKPTFTTEDLASAFGCGPFGSDLGLIVQPDGRFRQRRHTVLSVAVLNIVGWGICVDRESLCGCMGLNSESIMKWKGDETPLRIAEIARSDSTRYSVDGYDLLPGSPAAAAGDFHE